MRNFDTFIAFLDIAATKVAEELNYQSIASDIGVSPPTVANFFELLEDTLLGFRLQPFRTSVKRKSTSRPKFYLFDLGVTTTLMQRGEIARTSEAYGKAFEHFIALELRAYLSYRRSFTPLSFWRSQAGHEVDFVVGKECAIEVKAGKHVPDRALKGILALQEEGIVKKFIVISQESEPRKHKEIEILPWQEFLDRLWSDRIF